MKPILAAAAFAGLSTVLGGDGSLPGTARLVASTESLPLSAIDVRLTVSPDLDPVTRDFLRDEAWAIWHRAGVTLRWVSGPQDQGSRVLRVLVTPKLVGSSSAGHPEWAVGELLRFAQSGAIAVASIEGARRIVEDSGRLRPDLPAAVHDQRLGLVLGRAVAHEIGHFLLNTNTHAKRGLMRATFGSREFADPGADAFRLDAEAEAHLAAAAARGRPVPAMLPVEGFSYTR